MVAIAPALDRPGLRLSAAELMALRPPTPTARPRPASRRPGALPARIAGQGMDLREIRAFADGDDPRRIDPAATARTGHLHVRSFHEDRDDATLLIADFRHMMLWGSGDSLRSVRAGRHLAVLAWRAVARGGSLGLLVAGDRGPASLMPATGLSQMQAVAALLARCHDMALLAQVAGDAMAATHGGQQHDDAETAPAGLAPVLARARRLVPPGGRVHLATAPEGLAHCDAVLSRLCQRRLVDLHLILDPAELSPPRPALAVTQGRDDSRFGRIAAYDPQPLMAHLRRLGARPHLVRPDDA